MSEEFKIQCEACGTLYNDLEEVCPYCGTPQPLPEPHREEITIEASGQEETFLVEDQLFPEPSPANEKDFYSPEASPLADGDVAGTFPDEADAGALLDGDEGDISAEDFSRAGEAIPQPVIVADDTYLDEDEDLVEEEFDDLDDDFDEDTFEDEAEAVKPRFHRRRRLLLGCLGTLICISTFYGGIGALAAYNGWLERTQEVQAEAEQHYQRGQDHLAAGTIELAIAEFERALSLNPNLLPAREALRSAQNISESRPTPTSETRSAAAASLFELAEAEIDQENWSEALELLSQVRDLNPDYQHEQVSDYLFEIYYERGLALVDDERIDEALEAFNEALAERPDATAALNEQTKAALYLDGLAALDLDDPEQAVAVFGQLYQKARTYLDVERQLLAAYEQYGDALTEAEEWCQAEIQYLEAVLLAPDSRQLRIKAEESNEACSQQPVARTERTAIVNDEPVTTGSGTPATTRTPGLPGASTPQREGANGPAPTPEPTAGAQAVSTANGSIFFARYNPNDMQWEILSIPASGGAPQLIVANGIMPAVSPNGNLVLYRSEARDSEGFHIYDMTTGQDKRITIFRQDTLPRWGGSDAQFIFVAQEPATGRWRVQLGFADGKGESQILRDGRTPDLSPNNELIAYQGTDPEGNQPGIYVVPFAGGEPRRLTNHESDRMPIFSPDGSRIAYMSTANGNWDIFTISAEGGTPRQVTTYSGNDGLPVWSPDGSQIAFVSDQGGRWGIFTVDAAGGSPSRVTDWDGNQRADWLMAQISWTR